MKKRIISSILVVVMLVLSLTGCGYSLAKDDLTQYASIDSNKFNSFLQNITIADGDFTSDEEVRAKKVLDDIYALLVKAADGDALKEGKLEADDLASYCYYLVATKKVENTDVKVYYSSMTATKPTELALGYSDLAELSEMEAAIKAAALALDEVKDYIFDTEAASADGHTAYISYTVTPEGGEKATTHSYVKVILAQTDAAKAANGEHQFVVDKLISSKTGVGKTVSDFKKTEKVNDAEGNSTEKTLATYSKTTLHFIVDDAKALVDGAEVTLNADTKFKGTDGKEYTFKKDEKVTCYAYLTSFKQVEALTNESVIEEIFGSKLTKDSLDCLEKHEKLIEDYTKALSALDTAKTAEDKAQEAYDKAKESLKSDADEKTELADEQKALDDAKADTAEKQEAYDKALKALIDATVTEDDASVIVTEYKKSIYDSLCDEYNKELNDHLAIEIWEAMQDCVKVTSYPKKLVKKIYERIYANHEYTFYTSEKSDDEESLYRQHNGNFKSYLAEVTNTQGKNHQAAKDAVWAEAEEKVASMIVVYVVATEFEKLDTKADIKEYKKTATYQSVEASFGEDLTLTAHQFDTVMDYFLETEKKTETNDDGEEEEVPVEDDLGRYTYKNVKFTISESEEDHEEE